MTSEIRILRPKVSNIIFRALVCILFTLGGFVLSEESPMKGWVIALFFGLMSIIFLMQLIPGSSQLSLTHEGFIITSLFRSHLTPWSHVKEFSIGNLGPNKAVMLDYVDKHRKHSFGKRLAKSFSGRHGALPDTYGMRATELLQIMNAWKQKYGGS
jgi:hypothetical protein